MQMVNNIYSNIYEAGTISNRPANYRSFINESISTSGYRNIVEDR